MSMQTTPHINFRGEARAALEFYHDAFGGEISLATYADIHSVEDSAQENQIAFGRVTAPGGFDIMAYDVQPSKSFERGENSFYVTLQATTEDEVKAGWEALSNSAKEILIPLAPAPFSPLYGMLTDRFGITWIIGVENSNN